VIHYQEGYFYLLCSTGAYKIQFVSLYMLILDASLLLADK